MVNVAMCKSCTFWLAVDIVDDSGPPATLDRDCTYLGLVSQVYYYLQNVFRINDDRGRGYSRLRFTIA